MHHFNHFGNIYKINQHRRYLFQEMLKISRSEGALISYPLSDTEKKDVQENDKIYDSYYTLILNQL